MAVHEIRYRPYEGPLSLSVGRLWAIPKFSLQAVWGKVLSGMLFGMGSLMILGCTCYLFVTNNELVMTTLKIGKVPAASPERVMYSFLGMQIFLSFVIMATAGPRMISPELQHRALSLIYARPISRAGYVLGKFLGLAALVFYLTGLQSIVLFIAMWAFYPETHAFHMHFLTGAVPLLLKALLVAGSTASLLSLIALASSASSVNRKFATLVFLGLTLGSSVASGILANALAHSAGVVGILTVLSEINRAIFDMNPGGSLLTLPQAWFGMLVWCLAALLFLRWRLKPVDIYAE